MKDSKSEKETKDKAKMFETKSQNSESGYIKKNMKAIRDLFEN